MMGTFLRFLTSFSTNYRCTVSKIPAGILQCAREVSTFLHCSCNEPRILQDGFALDMPKVETYCFIDRFTFFLLTFFIILIMCYHCNQVLVHYEYSIYVKM